MYQPKTLDALRDALLNHGISLLGFERANGEGRLISRRTGDVNDPVVTEVGGIDEATFLDAVLANHGINPRRSGENPEVGRVSGYRKLTDEELALVNDIKAAGADIEELLIRARGLAGADNERLSAINLARTNLQQGAMWLIRAAAAPKGLF